MHLIPFLVNDLFTIFYANCYFTRRFQSNTQYSTKGRTIRNHGGGGKIFQWMNFLFSGNCLHKFFSDVKALHDFFSTALLLSYFGSVYLQEFF